MQNLEWRIVVVRECSLGRRLRRDKGGCFVAIGLGYSSLDWLSVDSRPDESGSAPLGDPSPPRADFQLGGPASATSTMLRTGKVSANGTGLDGSVRQAQDRLREER